MKVFGLFVGVVGALLVLAALVAGVGALAPLLALDFAALFTLEVVKDVVVAVVVGGVGVGVARWGFDG